VYYLGSAAFRKAIQAHDLHTSVDVCIKIIKNNKDFFDQSLDEIKLLKYVNKHDPGDKYHILRLYDYFYYRVSDSGRATDLVNAIAFHFQSIVVQHLILSFLGNFNVNFITIWMTK
jgi:serine/threonine protein kinase